MLINPNNSSIVELTTYEKWWIQKYWSSSSSFENFHYLIILQIFRPIKSKKSRTLHFYINQNLRPSTSCTVLDCSLHQICYRAQKRKIQETQARKSRNESFNHSRKVSFKNYQRESPRYALFLLLPRSFLLLSPRCIAIQLRLCSLLSTPWISSRRGARGSRRKTKRARRALVCAPTRAQVNLINLSPPPPPGPVMLWLGEKLPHVRGWFYCRFV